MPEELDLPIELPFSRPVFVPSHLTRFLLASGVAVGASGIALVSGVYALNQLRQITGEEVVAFVRPPK